MRTISLLGSTGSIGESTLAVLRLHPARLQVALCEAGVSTEVLCGESALCQIAAAPEVEREEKC